MNFYCQLNQLMCQDPGGRGLLPSLPQPSLKPVMESLMNARRAILLTGFPVRLEDGNTICGETDGPSGSANLAAALHAAGCQVWVVTDAPSYPLLFAALKERAPKAHLVLVPGESPSDFAKTMIRQILPTHVISLERPGKASDGHYYNMRGERIDDMVTDTDTFLSFANSCGIATLSIGDGGNELGMGTFRSQIQDHVPCGEKICAHQSSSCTLASGVSNWWGWGLSALLSLAYGNMLLPTEAEEARLLETVVAAGAVDGCTKRQALTVDAIPLEKHLKLLNQVRLLTKKAIEKPGILRHSRLMFHLQKTGGGLVN